MPTLTFHGHSCFVLEHGGKRVIIDPFLTGNPKADIARGAAPARSTPSCSPTATTTTSATPWRWPSARATVVAPYELALFCGDQGVPHVHAMHIGGAHEFPFGA